MGTNFFLLGYQGIMSFLPFCIAKEHRRSLHQKVTKSSKIVSAIFLPLLAHTLGCITSKGWQQLMSNISPLVNIRSSYWVLFWKKYILKYNQIYLQKPVKNLNHFHISRTFFKHFTQILINFMLFLKLLEQVLKNKTPFYCCVF